MWGFEAWSYDRNSEALLDQWQEQEGMGTPDAVPIAATYTDLGGKIELFSYMDPLSDQQLSSVSIRSNSLAMYADQTIRRGPPSDESNCHGWVFAGGRYNLPGRVVDCILTENGYAAVETPECNDLCVYRNNEGQVCHTAIVRAVLNDGTVLVEGKWGRMGVYLHNANESCYGTNYTFHRTSRGGHLLNGLSDDLAVDAASDCQ